MKVLVTCFLAFSFSASADWVDLFNGKDFTNFGASGKTEQNGYFVKDGIIESSKARYTSISRGWTWNKCYSK